MLPEISRRCLSCGAAVRAGSHFCNQCGEPLRAGGAEAEAAPSPHAEEGTPPTPEAPPTWDAAPSREVPPTAERTPPTDEWAPPTKEFAAFGQAPAGDAEQRAPADEWPLSARPSAYVEPHVIYSQEPPGAAEEAGGAGDLRGRVARVRQGTRARVERMRDEAIVVLEETPADPGLRFVVAAAALFVVFLVLLFLSTTVLR